VSLIRDPWTDRAALALVGAALGLTETARRHAHPVPGVLDVLANQLSWALLTRLDAQIGTSATGRVATHDGAWAGGGSPTRATTDPSAAPMVITVEPVSVRTSYPRGM
jgi:hypothetical protein